MQQDGLILITGATGFLGPYLLREFLATGAPVRVLVRNANHPALSPFAGKIELVVGDVTQPETITDAMAGVQQVVHAAGLVRFSKKDKEQLLAVNQHGTANVVNAALEAEVKKLVYVSSIAALGRPAGFTGLLDETATWQDSEADSYYGYSKHLGEREVARGVEEGLPAVICNPTIILGTGGWMDGSGKFFKRVDEGLPFYPVGSNGFTGATDVAAATRLLLNSDYNEAERFVICAENLSFQAFLTSVALALRKPPPGRALPPGLMLAAGWLLERWASITRKEPFFSMDNARSAAHLSAYNGQKFVLAFNYRYEPIVEVIRKTADAYRATKSRGDL